jgi:hypothetical protein
MPLSVNECNLRKRIRLHPLKYVSGEMFTCGKNADSESEPSVIFRTPAVG